ncbi:MAG: hypothetical protein ACHQJ4_07715, partial [Ignavibacteria bacterium]
FIYIINKALSLNNKDNNENTDNTKDNGAFESKKLRCINIDCVFNSSNNPDHVRNTCNHPKLTVDSKYADITIAICSEFRSKKDYRFEAPDILIELKTNEQVEIKAAPDPGLTEIEKVTTDELEKDYKPNEIPGENKPEQSAAGTLTPVYETPTVITTGEESKIEYEPKLTTDPGNSDFLILRKLYRPYLKRGVIVSIIIHLFAIWMIYAFVADKGKPQDVQQNQQRIVVVEDIEQQQPQKFDPPDIDREKEMEKRKDEMDKNSTNVRPVIKPKNIIPKIKRPKIQESDTTEITKKSNFDSLKVKTDSLLAANNKDTNRLVIPDSLKNFMPDNEIGMKLWYPKNWKLRDNRDVNLNLQQFKGVILNTDSVSEDPGAVTMFIQIDDPKHTTYNKTTYKNIFAMDDSTITAYSTDPQLTGASRISYKFFIFNDPTGNNNVFVNSETKKELFDKYKKYIEAIVRSVKIIIKSPSSDIK